MEILSPQPHEKLPAGKHLFSYLIRRAQAPTKEYWELNYRFHGQYLEQSEWYSLLWNNWHRRFLPAGSALEARSRHVLRRVGVSAIEFDYLSCVKLRSQSLPQYRHVSRLIVSQVDFVWLADSQFIDRIVHDESATSEDRIRSVIYGLTPLVTRIQESVVA
jgi:hypothetical protein